eukprot:SAG11_NODE_298_length_11076_cov_4.253621_9_plen_86_part_00
MIVKFDTLPCAIQLDLAAEASDVLENEEHVGRPHSELLSWSQDGTILESEFVHGFRNGSLLSFLELPEVAPEYLCGQTKQPADRM